MEARRGVHTDVATAARKPRGTKSAGESFAKALAAALAEAEHRGHRHHEVDAHIRRARRIARERVPSREPLVIEQHALEELEEAPELLAALRRHGVKGLCVQGEASLYELRVLVDALSGEPAPGGLVRALKRLGARRLRAIEWPPIAVPHRDLLACATAALEALRASPCLDARLGEIGDAGLRALAEIGALLERREDER